jgi:hypothetical protein
VIEEKKHTHTQIYVMNDFSLVMSMRKTSVLKVQQNSLRNFDGFLNLLDMVHDAYSVTNTGWVCGLI